MKVDITTETNQPIGYLMVAMKQGAYLYAPVLEMHGTVDEAACKQGSDGYIRNRDKDCKVTLVLAHDFSIPEADKYSYIEATIVSGPQGLMRTRMLGSEKDYLITKRSGRAIEFEVWDIGSGGISGDTAFAYVEQQLRGH